MALLRSYLNLSSLFPILYIFARGTSSVSPAQGPFYLGAMLNSAPRFPLLFPDPTIPSASCLPSPMLVSHVKCKTPIGDVRSLRLHDSRLHPSHSFPCFVRDEFVPSLARMRVLLPHCPARSVLVYVSPLPFPSTLYFLSPATSRHLVVTWTAHQHTVMLASTNADRRRESLFCGLI